MSQSQLQPPRLLEQMRMVLRTRHYGLRTEETYLGWVKRFILFHGKRHPRDMGVQEVQQFLACLPSPFCRKAHSCRECGAFRLSPVATITFTWLTHISRSSPLMPLASEPLWRWAVACRRVVMPPLISMRNAGKSALRR